MSVGECRLRLERNAETGLDEVHIEHADPHILISTTVLDEALFQPTVRLWVDFSNEPTCFEDHQHDNLRCFRLCSILHIKAVNREVLYRIGERDAIIDAYHGRWPD